MNLRIAKKILKNVKAGKCKYTELQIKTAEQKVQNASKKWGATKDIIWGESQLEEQNPRETYDDSRKTAQVNLEW